MNYCTLLQRIAHQSSNIFLSPLSVLFYLCKKWSFLPYANFPRLFHYKLAKPPWFFIFQKKRKEIDNQLGAPLIPIRGLYLVYVRKITNIAGERGRSSSVRKGSQHSIVTSDQFLSQTSAALRVSQFQQFVYIFF